MSENNKQESSKEGDTGFNIVAGLFASVSLITLGLLIYERFQYQDAINDAGGVRTCDQVSQERVMINDVEAGHRLVTIYHACSNGIIQLEIIKTGASPFDDPPFAGDRMSFAFDRENGTYQATTPCSGSYANRGSPREGCRHTSRGFLVDSERMTSMVSDAKRQLNITP